MAMSPQNASSSSSGDLDRPDEVVQRLHHSCSDLLPAGAGGDPRGANARPADARRRSYGDILTAPGGRRRRSSSRRGDDDDDAYQKRWQPGYVSFEDMIGTSSNWDEPDAGAGDPLLRTTSRLGRPRNRRIRSPGPLGTRRGSAMHGLVKKYVNPFIGFLAGIFCCTVP
ncbi:unnamed protein product [Urochloa decumbens]|uniref:Uncharacterized protein n=1 Tax=Urochloa decumbens TaxID=240449 RepID=A0ABC9F1X3_9POAL